jgi:divalent metal cation (Fe/Co/Zn/Cd) transporter
MLLRIWHSEGAGLASGSVALIGFGLDSIVEVTATGAAQWRLRTDAEQRRRENAERVTYRIVGGSFLALAAWVAYEASGSLWRREAPERSAVGLAVLILSVVIMPVLARATRSVARELLRSGALAAEANQNDDPRLPVRHRARRRGAACDLRLVVGRPPCSACHGSHHRA